MEYIVQQKIVALKPTYMILDEDGNEIYRIKGSFIGREKFEIEDLNDVPLAQCYTNLNFFSIVSSFLRGNFKKYHITVNGETKLTINRTFNPFFSNNESYFCFR